jgi:hypothetical protein
VPLLAGAAVGRRCANGRELPERCQVLGVAGAVIALGGVVLGLLAGGRLGAAVFNPVEIPAGPLAVALLVPTLLGGCAAILTPPRRQGSQPEDKAGTVVAEFDHSAVEAEAGSPEVELGDESAHVPPDDNGARAGEVGRRYEQRSEALVVLEERPTPGGPEEDDNGQ